MEWETLGRKKGPIMSTASDMTAAEVEEVAAIRRQRGFIGHPKAIGTLSTMQMCNSFANYTMSSLLVFYLYLSVGEGGLGFSQTEAAQLISLYSAVSILAGLVGSYVADRILGPRAALRWSRIIQAAAYVLLALPLGVASYAASQVLLVVGAMICGRSLDALAGMVYETGDERRDGAYTILYTISNIGAAVPAIAGAIAVAAGYHAAFAVGAVAAVAGCVAYVVTEKKFFGPIGAKPDDPVPAAQRNKFVTALVVAAIALIGGLLATGTVTISQFASTMSTAAIFIPVVYLVYIIKSKKTTREEASRIIGLIPMYVCNCLAMLVWTQSTSIVAIYIEQNVDLNLFGMELSPASFQTLPGVLAIIFGAVFTALWAKLGSKQPKTPTKMGFGTILWGLGPVFMCLPFMLFAPGVKVSPMWIVGFYALIILGEAFTSPTGYSAANLVAPAAFSTQMMTVWSLSQSTGAGLSTLVSPLYAEGSEIPYFLAIGGITIVAGLLVLFATKKLSAKMGLDKA